MVNEYNYVNIREVLSRVLRHPLLTDVSLESAIQYTLDFISLVGMPQMYQTEEVELEIKNYRAELPCNLIYIEQVRDNATNKCLRKTTDTFKPKNDLESINNPDIRSFKTQNRIIFTTFEKGKITIVYKSLPIDNDGYPLVINDLVFLKALELYIKNEVFNILFDLNKISLQVYQKTEQDYLWYLGKCQSMFTAPSLSEMESIKNMWCTLIPRMNEFETGFKFAETPENIKVH